MSADNVIKYVLNSNDTRQDSLRAQFISLHYRNYRRKINGLQQQPRSDISEMFGPRKIASEPSLKVIVQRRLEMSEMLETNIY